MRASSFNCSWNGVRWEPSVLKPEPAPASSINSSVQGSSRTYTHTQKLIEFICPAPSVLGLPIGYKVKWKHPAKQAHTFSPTLMPKPWMYNLTPGSLRASSPSFSHPAIKASPRACSQARPEATCKPPSLQTIALPRNKTPHSPTVKQMQTRDCKTWR